MKKGTKICLIILAVAVFGTALLVGGAEILKRLTIRTVTSTEPMAETAAASEAETSAVLEAETVAEPADAKAGTEDAVEGPKKTISEYEMTSWANDIFQTATESGQVGKAPELPLTGKVILAFHDSHGCNVYSKRSMMAKTDPHPEEPYFQAVVSDGEPKYKDIPAAVWADSFEECDYLIVFGGFETGRVADYYGAGIDRVSTKTVVYVIDPAEKQVLIEKNIGTDTPENVTGHPTGQVMHDEADAYITYILTGKQEE